MEFCPNCGNRVNAADSFCSTCGKPISQQRPETELLSFGPFGVSACFGRPGFFVVTQQNNTRVVVTDRRVYGMGRSSGELRFDVPYEAITLVEKNSYALFRVLYIAYREGGKAREVSVMGNPSNYGNIARAYELVQKK